MNDSSSKQKVVDINTGKSVHDTNTYENEKGKTSIPLVPGRPNYPEQTEIDADEAELEQSNG